MHVPPFIYCIRHIFRVQIFSRFRTSQQTREGLLSQFCDVFITVNSHVLKLKFSRGLTREIRENKTTAKITTYPHYAVVTVCDLRNIWDWEGNAH